MKILFFYIDTQTSSGYTSGLGVASISGYLKRHGISTGLVYYKTDRDFKYAMNKIRDVCPDIIGFYSTSVNHKTVQILSGEIKRQFPDILQIYGGIHATLVPQTIEEIQGLDAVCVGYGEVPMLETAKNLASKKDISCIPGLWVRLRENGAEKIIKNRPYFPEFKADEFLDFDYSIFLKELSRFPDFDMSNYRLETIFNRTCPFSCSFCCNQSLREIYNNRKFVPLPETSIKHLKRSIQDTGLKFVEIYDDNLTMDKEWFREFILRYAKEIRLPFECSLRVDCFNEEDVKLLKNANIRSAWIGVESGNDYIRNTIMKKNITGKQITEGVRLLHDYKISVNIQNIIGVPHETPQCFIDTVKINAECWPSTCYMLSIFYPYPKTDLYELCVRENLFNEDYGNIVERTRPVLNLPYFPEKKIIFYYRNFKRLIWYQYLRMQRPYIFFIPLKDQTSWVIAKLGHIFEILLRKICKATGFKK